MTQPHLWKAPNKKQDEAFNRRQFVRLAAFPAVSSWLTGCNSDNAARKDGPEVHSPMPVIDYGLSFISGRANWNRVRFWVESRTRIIDERSGDRRDYYQCASCKSENTFAKDDLFMADNYDFVPIFGPDDGVIFRRKSRVTARYREWKTAVGMWGGQEYKLRTPRSSRLLTTAAEIRQATDGAHPLVGQTEISNKDTGLRAVIEFPVKTMNIRDEVPTYQVDTGPIALPDLSKRYDRPADCLALAFVALNTFDFADFVIEDETPIIENGKEIARVHHYSRRQSLPSENRLFAIDG